MYFVHSGLQDESLQVTVGFFNLHRGWLSLHRGHPVNVPILSMMHLPSSKSKYCRNIAAILRQYCCNMNLLPKPAYSESCNIAASGNIAAILQLLPERAYTESCNIATSGNIAAILQLQSCDHCVQHKVLEGKIDDIASRRESVCFLEFHVKRIDLSFIWSQMTLAQFRIKSKFIYMLICRWYNLREQKIYSLLLTRHPTHLFHKGIQSCNISHLNSDLL